MNVRLKLADKMTNAQKERIKEYAAEQFKLQSHDQAVRFMKLVCLVLNEDFGFGAQRLRTLIGGVNDLSGKRNGEWDDVFWYKVDRELKKLGLDFPDEDYDRMDFKIE